jgi:hypothetical protein
MGDGLDQLILVSPLSSAPQVGAELLGAVQGRQCGDGDEAAVPRRQVRALPHVTEQHFVGQLNELGCEVADEFLGSGLLFGHRRRLLADIRFAS